MNYQEILNRFKYEDESEIMERIASAENANYRENRDIINEITASENSCLKILMPDDLAIASIITWSTDSSFII